MADRSEVERLFRELAEARKANITVFAEMARFGDAQAFGFVARDPDAKDVTVEIMRAAAAAEPARMAELLGQVIENDERVTGVARQIVFELTR